MPLSVSQVLKDFGLERFDDPAPSHHNIILDVVPANSSNPTSSTIQNPLTKTVSQPPQTASPPTATPSPPPSTLSSPRAGAQAVVSGPGNENTIEKLLNSMEAELTGASNALLDNLSAVLAPKIHSDVDFHEISRAPASQSSNGQRSASPQPIAAPLTEDSHPRRRPPSSAALEEYRRHLATLLALAEDAPQAPSASNNFMPVNLFIDRFAAIGSLMKSYRDLPDNEIGMENTTVGQRRGRLQQIVDLQWQVFENGLTGDIMELDQLMRGKTRGESREQYSRSDSGSGDGESSGGETARPQEIESEIQDRDGTRPARGRSASVYARGSRGGAIREGRGRGRGSGGGWEESSSSRDVRRGRSRAPSPRNFNCGSSGNHGEERGRARGPAPWDDVPSLDSRPGRGRGLEDLGLSPEELAFIMSGPVDPASVNAPAAESTETENTDHQDQDGNDHLSGEDDEHDSGDDDGNSEEDENYYDAEDADGDAQERYEADYRRAMELSMIEQGHMQNGDREEEHEQETEDDGSTVGGRDDDHDMDTASATATLMGSWSETPTNPRDQGREERSMALE